MTSRFSAGPRRVSLVTLGAVLGACTSTTTINSQPSGARLYLNGEAVGTTPYTMSDTKIVGTATTVRLEMPGYDPTSAVITRNEEVEVGACIAGVFMIPLLWIMRYKPRHDFELKPAGPPGYAGPQAYAPPPGSKEPEPAAAPTADGPTSAPRPAAPKPR